MFQNSFGRPDDVVARETLENHIRQNDSFVLAVFQAQFRSSLTCPRCQRQSNTFDPFLCVSVPVPQEQPRPLYVTILYTSQQPRQVSHFLKISCIYILVIFTCNSPNVYNCYVLHVISPNEAGIMI